MFKHKSWIERNRTVIGVGAQIFSFFILEVVVTIIITLGGVGNIFQKECFGIFEAERVMEFESVPLAYI